MEKDEELERLKEEKMEEIMKKGKKKNYPESPLKITDSNFEKITKKYPFVVIDFSAEWCSACKPMKPLIERLAKKYAGEVVFGKINIDKNRRITKKFSVSSIPTLLFVKDEKPIDKTIGLIPQEKLEEKLNKYLN